MDDYERKYRVVEQELQKFGLRYRPYDSKRLTFLRILGIKNRPFYYKTTVGFVIEAILSNILFFIASYFLEWEVNRLTVFLVFYIHYMLWWHQKEIRRIFNLKEWDFI